MLGCGVVIVPGCGVGVGRAGFGSTKGRDSLAFLLHGNEVLVGSEVCSPQGKVIDILVKHDIGCREKLSPQLGNVINAIQAPYDQSGYYSGEPSSSSKPYQQPSAPLGHAEACSSGSQSGQHVQVRVRREKHIMKANKYFFKDVKGKVRSTVKSDWKQIKHNGKKVWALYGGKNVYISDIEIS